MSEYTKEETGDKEMIFLNRVFAGFLIGVSAVMSLWLMSGLLYVILK